MTRTRWMRPLNHPGPVADQRRTSIGTTTIVRRAVLPPGAQLWEALADAVNSLGATSGQVELLDGTFSRLSYCATTLSEDGSTAFTYSPTVDARVPARLIAGSATVGFRDGERFAHCHATWFDADGQVRGGHVFADSVVGSTPVHVLVHAFEDVEMQSITDLESSFPTFVPHRRDAHGLDTQEGARSVITRVAPGVGVAEAVVDIMRESGFERASIAGSLGSFVGAVLLRQNGMLVIDGPATEVTLTGEFDLTDPHAPVTQLNGMAVDRFGAVHAGQFVPEETIVAATLELLVEEVVG